jgi:parallel beta-helix repeat protein
MAVGLSFILTTGLVYVWMPKPLPLPIELPPGDGDTRHAPDQPDIDIDGDANFSDIALLEGWPGDGSPENPFIIDGLNIDFSPDQDDCGCFPWGECISISNTRVNFIIRNCNLTGARIADISYGAGIYLQNVSNGVLVNNTCSSNSYGILLHDSTYNIVANNTCNSNTETYGPSIGTGIEIFASDSNTVVNNTCNNNFDSGISLSFSKFTIVANNTCNSNFDSGISLYSSSSNIVANNTCNSNDIGIFIHESSDITVTHNTCNNNRIGISLYDFYGSYWNFVAFNICWGNTEHNRIRESGLEEFVTEESDPEVLLLIGFVGYVGLIGITPLVGIWIVAKRGSKG